MRSARGASSTSIALIYELLDAHDDTARMAAALAYEPSWASHLEYLRSLQQVGRELLAQLYSENSA
jgi:hypothetical protein